MSSLAAANVNNNVNHNHDEGEDDLDSSAEQDVNADDFEDDEEGDDDNREDEQQEEDDDLAEARRRYLPAYLRGPLDPARMVLTPQERQWALEVKDGVEGLPDLDNLTDFMYAQIALVERGNLANSIRRAYTLQSYREECDIQESFSQGARLMAGFINRNPGYCLHFFMADGRYTVALDVTKFDITCVDCPQETLRMMAGGYYQFHAFYPDFEAIRQGVHFIMECEGYLWKAPKMVNFRVFRLGFEDVMSSYPHHLHKMRFVNTGVLINTLCSMIKRYIPPEIHTKFEMAGNSDTRLDAICLVPSLEAATQRVVREMTESLRRRYLAEEAFRLE